MEITEKGASVQLDFIPCGAFYRLFFLFALTWTYSMSTLHMLMTVLLDDGLYMVQFIVASWAVEAPEHRMKFVSSKCKFDRHLQFHSSLLMGA